MKKILFIFTIVLAFSSCSDELQLSPIDSETVANIYDDEDDFEQALNGMYNRLSKYCESRAYLNEVRSDNIYGPGGDGLKKDWNFINNFSSTLAVLTTVQNAWDRSYEAIYRANMILDQIDSDKVADDDTRARMMGECYFTRALYTFDMVRYFGKLPYVDGLKTISESLSLGRSDVSDIYGLIESDLNIAIEMLPETYPSAQTGKATSGAAKSLLAKVLITMSSPGYGIEGPGLDANRWQEAVDLIDEVIASGVYGWVDDYMSIFDYNNENNPDIIFDVQSMNDGNLGDRGIGTILPALYYNSGWAQVMLFPAGGAGSLDMTVSEDLYNSFEEGDLRNNENNIITSYLDADGQVYERKFYLKFCDPQYVPTDRYNWGINYPIIRYTDVLMLKAEALLRLGQDQATVDEIVNKVRERAGLAPLAGVTIDELYEERRHEFICEGHRWDDLVRSGKVVEVMNEFSAVTEADLTVKQMEQMTVNDIIFPVPQSEMDTKGEVYTQNPGY